MWSEIGGTQTQWDKVSSKNYKQAYSVILNPLIFAIIPVCPRIISFEKKQSQWKRASSIVLQERKSLFLESLVKINRWARYKKNNPLSSLLVFRLIMSLAERLSSKLYIFPRSFASRPNISNFWTISQLWTLLAYLQAARMGLFTN